MPQEHVIGIDPSKPLGEEPGTGHNRWHEAIEPVVEADPGDTVTYETRDAFDGLALMDKVMAGEFPAYCAERAGRSQARHPRFFLSLPHTVGS